MKAIVWRKSVYDSCCCPNCGTRLIKPDNMPTNVIRRGLFRPSLYCENCGLFVAMIKNYHGDLKGGERGGMWGADNK